MCIKLTHIHLTIYSSTAQECLFQLLLGAQVAGMSTLLLATVVGTWVQSSVAPVSMQKTTKGYNQDLRLNGQV